MQEILNLYIQNTSHADIFDILSPHNISLDDFHDYTFKVHPGVQVHLEIDTISSIRPHLHRFYEVIFVVQGENIHYILDSQHYKLKSGSIFFIPPEHIHHPLLDSTNTTPYKRYVIWFESKFFHQICEYLPSVGYLFNECERKNDYVLQCSDSDYMDLLTSLQILCKENNQDKFGWNAKIALDALALMNQLGQSYFNNSLKMNTSTKPTKFDEAITFINQHICEHITLEDIAQALFISKSSLSHLFQNSVGISVYQYIQQKRLLKAKLLILEGESMANICEQCGFADYPTFYRAFKKKYGMSPKEYKNTF